MPRRVGRCPVRRDIYCRDEASSGIIMRPGCDSYATTLNRRCSTPSLPPSRAAINPRKVLRRDSRIAVAKLKDEPRFSAWTNPLRGWARDDVCLSGNKARAAGVCIGNYRLIKYYRNCRVAWIARSVNRANAFHSRIVVSTQSNRGKSEIRAQRNNGNSMINFLKYCYFYTHKEMWFKYILYFSDFNVNF